MTGNPPNGDFTSISNANAPHICLKESNNNVVPTSCENADPWHVAKGNVISQGISLDAWVQQGNSLKTQNQNSAGPADSKHAWLASSSPLWIISESSDCPDCFSIMPSGSPQTCVAFQGSVTLGPCVSVENTLWKFNVG